MPLAEEANEEIALKLAMQHLRYEVQVAYEGRLQDDGYVTSIEELDGVGETLASHTLAVELKLNSEALEEDDDDDNENCGDQVADVWRVLSVKSLLESVELI